jgi:hypothetical protein
VRTRLEPASRRYFWADPFPADDDEPWIIVEEFDKLTGLGSIVGLRLAGNRIVERTHLLGGGHHYSFPQVHRDETGWHATVETCARDNSFTFDRLGDPWQPTGHNLPWGLVDPAVTETGKSGWALTGVRRGHRHTYSQFVASGPLPRDFHEQPELGFHSPETARGGGNLDAQRGLRVVQDCSGNYGMAVEIVSWGPGGQGDRIRRLDRTDLPPDLAGAHTLAWTPDGARLVMDAWAPRSRWDAAALRLNERRHKRFCANERRYRRQARIQARGSADRIAAAKTSGV